MMSVSRRDRRATSRFACALLVLALYFPVLCFPTRTIAQAQGADTTAPAGEGYTVGGTVINSVTGEPIRKALVQISNLPGTPPAMLTNSEGRFQFEHVPVADVFLMARKPGFFNEQELHPDSVPQTLVLHVDRNTSDLVIKLFPEGIIFGRVGTVKGDPLEDTPVRAFQQRVMDGRKRWVQTGQVMSDEDGQFRIGGLQSGQYVLSAGPTFGIGRMRVRGKARQEQIVTSYYPGVADFEASTPVSVASGQQLQADFFLKPEPVFKVSGTVSGGVAGATASPQFMTRSGEGLPAPVSFDPQTGKFDAEVPAGTYLIILRQPDAPGNQLGTDVPITVNSDMANVALGLGGPLLVPVQVEYRETETSSHPENGEEVAGNVQPNRMEFFSGGASGSRVLRHQRFRINPVQVRLISTENRLQREEFQADSTVQGSFAIRNFTPGKYTVDLQPNSPWYVQSAKSGSVDLLREDLVIGPGRRPDPIEIVLRDDGANLAGSIHVEGIATPGAVLLIPEQAGPSQIRVVQAAPGGDFLVDRVPPGDYKLLSVDTLEGFEFRNAEVLAPYLSKATRVSLQPRQQASVTLERVSVGK